MGALCRTVAIALPLCACSVSANPLGTSFLCGEGDRCPSGMQCHNGHCIDESLIVPMSPDASLMGVQLVLTNSVGDEIEAFDGQPINLNRVELAAGGFSIRVVPDRAADVVTFDTDGGWSFEANSEPFDLAGTGPDGAPIPFPYQLGEDLLQVRALAGGQEVGSAASPLIVELEPISPAVAGFFVVDVESKAVTTLADGDTLDVSTWPQGFNIQVQSLPSVVRELRVSMIPAPDSWTADDRSAGERSDGYAPYFAGGDDLGDALELADGQLQIVATPVGADGSDGTPLAITVDVTGG